MPAVSGDVASPPIKHWLRNITTNCGLCSPYHQSFANEPRHTVAQPHEIADTRIEVTCLACLAK